jgi:hypothetical protein
VREHGVDQLSGGVFDLPAELVETWHGLVA